MQRIRTTTVAAALVAALALGSATTLRAQQQQQQGGCGNNVGAAAIGGLLGALVKDKNRGQGAAIGAVLGAIACMAIDAQSRQTTTADSALQDYQARNGGQAPTRVVLDGYDSRAPSQVARQQDMKIQSAGTLIVPPAQQRTAQFTEVLQLQAPNEQPNTISRKPIAVRGGGGFEQTFGMTLPRDLAQGMYRYRTQVLDANDNVLGERTGQFQVL